MNDNQSISIINHPHTAAQINKLIRLHNDQDGRISELESKVGSILHDDGRKATSMRKLHDKLDTVAQKTERIGRLEAEVRNVIHHLPEGG